MDSTDDFRPRRPGLLAHVNATNTIAFVLVGVWAAMVLSGVDPMRPSTRALLDWGANHGSRSLVDEPWRLVTAGLLHGGLVHLAFNVMVLLSLGFMEQVYGRTAWVVVFLVAVVTGNLASAAAHGPPSVGASGGVFGLFGATLALAVAPRSRTGLPTEARRALLGSILRVLALNALLAFAVKNLDHRAHLGGLVGGFVVGLASITPPFQPGRTRRAVVVGALSALALVGAFFVLRPSADERASLRTTDEASRAATTLLDLRQTLQGVEADLRRPGALPGDVEARLDRARRDLEAVEAAFARYGVAHRLRPEASPDPIRAAMLHRTRQELGVLLIDVTKRRATTPSPR